MEKPSLVKFSDILQGIKDDKKTFFKLCRDVGGIEDTHRTVYEILCESGYWGDLEAIFTSLLSTQNSGLVVCPSCQGSGMICNSLEVTDGEALYSCPYPNPNCTDEEVVVPTESNDHFYFSECFNPMFCHGIAQKACDICNGNKTVNKHQRDLFELLQAAYNDYWGDCKIYDVMIYINDEWNKLYALIGELNENIGD